MSVHSHLYKTKQWQRFRAAHLAGEPLCRACCSKGRITIAKVADHITPHRGNLDLFWNASNLQSLCYPCHNRDKQQDEWTDQNVSPVGEDGYKLDGSW